MQKMKQGFLKMQNSTKMQKIEAKILKNVFNYKNLRKKQKIEAKI
jgi:hypothetical protein